MVAPQSISSASPELVMMTMAASGKSHPGVVAVPRSLSTIAGSVGMLALFLVIASLLLISHPVGSSYRMGADKYLRSDGSVPVDGNQTKDQFLRLEPQENGQRDVVIKEAAGADGSASVGGGSAHSGDGLSSPSVFVEDPVLPTVPQVRSGISSTTESSRIQEPVSSNKSGPSVDGLSSPNATLEDSKLPSALPDGSQKVDSKSCDLFNGQWVHDPAGPLYTNNTCPVITQMQNCQGNGRPDKDYENWRWRPHQCELPRFDARKFLQLMKGKTLAFIGDSVARNQMESMLCILWQVEAPKNRGNRRMQRWYFRSTSTFVVRIWSSWLVHRTSESFQFAPDGLDKVHLDLPDETFMDFLPSFDVVVLSSAHWFAKRSAYILNGAIVGGQLWWPKEAGAMQVNNVEAFGISVETALSSIASHPNFTGLAVVRSFSPDHYEGGAWNTGGSCTGKVRPLSELVSNGFTEVMHEKQVAGFKRAVNKLGSDTRSRFRLMDITKVFGYRPDGHPGPYRNPDPNKVTKRGPNGKPPPQDCLHWCMPGPIDTWNEMLMEIIRRDYEGA